MKQQKEETGKDSSEKTRTSEKNEVTIKEHDQKIAMN
jgi:hypothetical protein